MKDAYTVSQPVRVSLPASVANDIKSFKESVGTILDKLGCPACCSGHDIHFELQRDIVLEDLGGIARVSTPALEATGKSGFKRVALNPAKADDLATVHKAIERIADFTGHLACCSGHDLRIQLERNFVLDEKLNLTEQVARFG